ncbi:MAG: PEP-CTERM sorting domain-containing protein [Phycisphaerales bacterium]|nr:PEP-CTERM sorting domain-containing protein [Phycisphaerales bacterium]
MIRTTVVTVAGLAAIANAGIFSFASDSSDQHWTLLGDPHGGHYALEDGTPTGSLMDLFIDDHNGVLDPLVFRVDFNAHLDIDYASSSPIGGGKFLHTYHIEGDAGWYTAAGPVLEMTVDGGLLTIVGDEFSWDTAGSIFGADTWAGVQYTSYVDAPDYGMYEGMSVGPQDFSFSLTALNASGTIPYDWSMPGTALDPQTMLPVDEIYAEVSFSGSARFIPAPGSMALLGLGGMLSARRRR